MNIPNHNYIIKKHNVNFNKESTFILLISVISLQKMILRIYNGIDTLNFDE